VWTGEKWELKIYLPETHTVPRDIRIHEGTGIHTVLSTAWREWTTSEIVTESC
jgi:hypothetical protein